jgi:hopanoid biosynthesis associated protein HpnK
VRRLIINADDFGFTPGVNRAIVETHAHGIVTSTTLMANGPAFREAIQMAKAAPLLSIGCHVVLIDGQPISPTQQVSSLVGRDETRFRDDLKIFAARAILDRFDADQIEAETSAQIRKIQSESIVVSHLDTHKHTHLFPKILRPILRAAAACGVRAIRNPFGPRGPLQSRKLLVRPSLWRRTVEMRILNRFANKFRQEVNRHGFATPDGTLGIEVTGALDETLFRAIAETIPEGTWEFVTHPGYNDADLQAAKTRLRDSREAELRTLTLPASREILAQAGIELISYRALTI